MLCCKGLRRPSLTPWAGMDPTRTCQAGGVVDPPVLGRSPEIISAMLHIPTQPRDSSQDLGSIVGGMLSKMTNAFQHDGPGI